MNDLTYAIDMIQEAELSAISDVADAKYALSKKKQLMGSESDTEFVQEGLMNVVGIVNFFTEKIPAICDIFKRKFREMSSRYKIAELRKENDKLRYQLDAQSARLESVEKALGGKAAVDAGGEVTFTYDYSTVTKMIGEIQKQFDKLDISLDERSLDKLASVIETASGYADKAVRTVKQNKTVKMAMAAGSDVINSGLEAIQNVPQMLSTLKKKAVDMKKDVSSGKAKPDSPQTAGKIDVVISGLTSILGKVGIAGKKQLEESSRIVGGKQRTVVASDHKAVVGKKAERARESGDFDKEQQILRDDAKRRKKALSKQNRTK